MNLTEEQIARYVTQGYRLKYGKLWAPQGGKPPSDMLIEFQAFRNRITGPECPGAHIHFKNIVNAIWNHPKSTKKVDWNPWAERMIEQLCNHKYLAIAGCASSGKTRIGGALWGIVNFLAAPRETKVLLTSTSLKDSRQRVWGEVEEYWMAAAQLMGGEQNLPGELASSAGMIRYKDGDMRSDRQGLTLIAGEKSKAKESIGKVIGFKGTRVILIADELPELSEALINAAESNLASNPEFQMIGIGNPNSYFDPFGVFCEPEKGWNSISELDYEWKTKKGFCIRFDAEKSPNILAGKTIYPYMMTQEKLDDFQKRLGVKTLRYYRMVKGFWCPTGSEEAIYTEPDIVNFEGNVPAIWREPPVMVAGLDPSFTHGGDRCVLKFAKFGVTVDNLKALEWVETVELEEDATNKRESRTYQLVDKLILECQKRGVERKHLCADSTGGGKPFCDVIRDRWGTGFLEVNFSEAATDKPASSTDPRPAKEVFMDIRSEIWFAGREYLQTGQIKGIDPALAEELCARQYTTKNRGKIQVESKLEMKKRIGRSPDLADAALLALFLCRQRLGFNSKPSDRASDNGEESQGFARRMRSMSQKFAAIRRY